MAETEDYRTVDHIRDTATILPTLIHGTSQCRLKATSDYEGSRWVFTIRDHSTFEPAYPIHDDRTVAAVKTDGPLTADDDFFAPQLRATIAAQTNHSNNPRDWYLKEMQILTQDDQASLATEGTMGEHRVRLIFEAPRYRISQAAYFAGVVKDLSLSLLNPVSAQLQQG